MDQPVPKATLGRLRALIRQIAAATDSQMLRILATVESAADRREADALISPMRPRLNVLRPPRRLRIRRLIFYPLDPLILPPHRWRPGMPSIPRSILAPVAEAITASMPDTVARVEALLADRTTADMGLIRATGSVIWPGAAAALDSASPPASWRDTGLAAVHYRTLAPAMAALLRQAAAIETLILSALPGLLPPPTDAGHAILRGVEGEHPRALPALFVLLMMRLPDPAALFALPRGDPLTPRLSAARAEAAGFLLERIGREGADAWVAGGSLAEAAETVRRLLVLLTQIDRTGATALRPACRTLRHALDRACRLRFEAGVLTEMLPALARDPPDAEHLEATAFGLALFQAEAREAGGKHTYDAALGTLATAIRRHTSGTLAARLTEILLGTDAALGVLG